MLFDLKKKNKAEAKAERSLSSRLVWSAKGVPGQLGLPGEYLSQENRQRNKQKKPNQTRQKL